MLKADDDFLMQRSVFSSEAEVIANRGRTVFKTDEGEEIPPRGFRIKDAEGKIKKGQFSTTLIVSCASV